MKNKTFKISLTVLLLLGAMAVSNPLLFTGSETGIVFAQTDDVVKAENPDGKTAPPDKLVKDEGIGSLSGNDDETEKNGTTGKPPVQNPPAVKSGKTVQPAVENITPADGLLDITEGAFKYRRIPGIRISEVATDASVEIPGRNENVKEKDPMAETGNGRGLFGLSQKTTDLLAKLVLFGVVLLIFILYRFRTRGRRSGVLKRFPKA